MFEKLKEAIGRLLSGSAEEPFTCDTRTFDLKIKCAKCGEVIPVRIDRDHEIQPQYDEDAEEGDQPTEWLLHKEIVGANCQNIIHFTLRFGCDHGLMSSSIEGGEFLTPELEAGRHGSGEDT